MEKNHSDYPILMLGGKHTGQSFCINANCDEEIIKQRLLREKGREDHILGDQTHSMYLLFEKAYDPMEGPHENVDTGQDIVPQVQRIIKKLRLG
jgi:hypothetical protein